MDKIIVDMETQTRECVACDFSEARPGDEAAPGELPTRVSRAAARRVETPIARILALRGFETPAEAVTLVDPAAGTKDKAD